MVPFLPERLDNSVGSVSRGRPDSSVGSVFSSGLLDISVMQVRFWLASQARLQLSK